MSAVRQSGRAGPRSRQRERGVTLVEMMIALLIGTLVVGAAVALYLSVSRAMLYKRDIEKAQQGLRFVQQMLVTRLQQAESISSASTDRMLVLEQPGALGDAHEADDCAGHEHNDAAGWTETIAYDAGRLTCQGAVLLDGVASLSLRYGRDLDGNHYLQDSEYQSADALRSDDDWSRVVAVRLEIGFANDTFQGAPRRHVLLVTRHRQAWNEALEAGEEQQ